MREDDSKKQELDPRFREDDSKKQELDPRMREDDSKKQELDPRVREDDRTDCRVALLRSQCLKARLM